MAAALVSLLISVLPLLADGFFLNNLVDSKPGYLKKDTGNKNYAKPYSSDYHGDHYVYPHRPGGSYYEGQNYPYGYNNYQKPYASYDSGHYEHPYHTYPQYSQGFDRGLAKLMRHILGFRHGVYFGHHLTFDKDGASHLESSNYPHFYHQFDHLRQPTYKAHGIDHNKHILAGGENHGLASSGAEITHPDYPKPQQHYVYSEPELSESRNYIATLKKHDQYHTEAIRPDVSPLASPSPKSVESQLNSRSIPDIIHMLKLISEQANGDGSYTTEGFSERHLETTNRSDRGAPAIQPRVDKNTLGETLHFESQKLESTMENSQVD